MTSSPDPSDVALTIGRELLAEFEGDLDLDLVEHELLLADRTEQRIILRTTRRTLSPEIMSALGERGYSAVFKGKADGPQSKYGWHIEIPDETRMEFAAYVDARGGPLPAPPKTATEQIFVVSGWKRVPAPNYDDAEYLPHPKVEALAFRQVLEHYQDQDQEAEQ